MTPSSRDASREEHSSLKRMDSELPNSTFDEEEQAYLPGCVVPGCSSRSTTETMLSTNTGFLNSSLKKLVGVPSASCRATNCRNRARETGIGLCGP